MKTGIELITQERQRQIDIEGYNVFEDTNSYNNGEIIGAAACYAVNALNKLYKNENPNDNHDLVILKMWDNGDAWPWESSQDKREKHDVLRSLVIAGALIAAEIDRLTN